MDAPAVHPYLRDPKAFMKTFDSLTEQEILALAISQEEEDARIYGDFAEGLQTDYPGTAKMLQEMRGEEDGHRHHDREGDLPERRRRKAQEGPAEVGE